MKSVSSPTYDTLTRDAGATDKQCVFQIGRGWFSLPALAVKEITPASEIAHVPGSHQSLAGLCHVRSEFVPVLRLNALLQEPLEPSRQDQKLLVIEGNGGNWALLVDQIIALVSLETLIHPDQRVDGSPSLILGTATCREQIVRVLDPNGVFRHASESLQQSWAAIGTSLQPLRSSGRSHT